jgi:tRNA threonylcarbamoyladenosine biosynthesis protein TsaE
MDALTLHSHDETTSLAVGQCLGAWLGAGDVVTLRGDLGAGKTLLARGIARGLGVPASIPVTSPSFTFINEYDGRLHLYHLDLYRVTEPADLETLPWREALFGSGVAVVEWPERLEGALAGDRWDIELVISGEHSRVMILRAYGARNPGRLKELAGRLRRAGFDVETRQATAAS